LIPVRTVKTIAIGIGLGAWVLLPILGLVLAQQRDARLQFAPTEPVFAAVLPAPEAQDREVGLVLGWSEPAQLVAPQWDGVVDRVLAGRGTVVNHGAGIVSIEGIERRAWVTPGAFFRNLSFGDRGEDVTWLNGALGLAGLRHGEADRFTAETTAGVRQFATDIGVTAPDGTFDPNWVIFTPNDELTLAEVLLTVGAPAPAPGSVLSEAQIRLESAAIVSAADILSIQDDEGPERPAEERAAAMTAVNVAENESLLLQGAELELDEARKAVAGDGLRKIEQVVLSGAGSVIAQVRTPSNPGAVMVPTAALVAGDGDAVCVVAKTEGRTEVVPVELVWDASGSSVIRAARAGALTGAKVRIPAGELPGGCS
jgi:hypothetical protein